MGLLPEDTPRHGAAGGNNPMIGRASSGGAPVRTVGRQLITAMDRVTSAT
jgi:hypothetical protein